MLDEVTAADHDTLPDLYEATPIATIEMMSATDPDDSDDEPLPWIDLRVYRAEPERVIAPKAPVLKVTEAVLLLDYPMDTPATRTIRAANGSAFSRDELMAGILSTYEAVYDSERLTQTAPTPPVDERGTVLNRPASDGVFGIDKHDLDDLGVSRINVYNIDGTIWLSPDIES